MVTEIKKTNQCTNAFILALEQHIQTVATHASHFYSQYFQFRLRLKTLIVANSMPSFWITINLADFVMSWSHMTSHVMDLTWLGQFQIITDPASQGWLSH